MKKLLASLLALAILLGMTTRGQGNQPTSSATGADEPRDKVEKTGILVVGLDDAFPPVGYKDINTGELTGFDIDLVKETCKRFGVELKLQSIDRSNKQVELDNGNVDCLWNGFSKTPERVEAMALSIPYMSNNRIIPVKTESTYKTLKDLSDRVVGVQGDFSAGATLSTVEDKEFKSSLENVVQTDDYIKAILKIQNGTIDAISIDEVITRFYPKNQSGPPRILENGGTAIPLMPKDHVVGMREDDLVLKDKIDEIPRVVVKDDTMTIISGKWLGEDVTTVDMKQNPSPKSVPEVQAMNYQMLSTEMSTATLMSLQILFFALIVSSPLGLLVALGRMPKLRTVNLPVHFYIPTMHGTLLMLQLSFMFYVLKPLLGIQLDRVLVVEVTLVLNYAAHFAEIYRGGLESIPNGQRGTTKILGYTESQAFFHIALSQVIKRITPPMGNKFITLVKDTSLVQVIGVVELLEVISQWVSNAVDMTPLVIAGLSYLVMNGAVTRAFTVLENRLSYY